MDNRWDGNIETARESGYDNLSEPGADGNRTYDISGTYGQSDYTVRQRNDGTSDVYTSNPDSPRLHTHDQIDRYGNILNNFHDYLVDNIEMFSEFELNHIVSISSKKLLMEISNLLRENSLHEEKIKHYRM